MASSLRSPGWRPPGQPPAVAVARRSGREGLLAGGGLLAITVAVALLDGLEPADLRGGLGAWLGGIALLIGLSVARTELRAGPGWLSVRSYVRRHWVRTDRLVELDTVRGRHGGTHAVVLHDAEGRSVTVPVDDLALGPKVALRVAEDVRRSLAVVGLDPDAAALLTAARGRPRRRRRRRR